MGKLAFSIEQPGQPLVTDEFDQYARNLFRAMMSQADAAILKRLVFEGHMLVLGQLPELITDPNAGASRKLPAVEREHRMQELERRLNGVVFERWSCLMSCLSRRSRINFAIPPWNVALQGNGASPWERTRSRYQ